jgi:hypothetical protein
LETELAGFLSAKRTAILTLNALMVSFVTQDRKDRQAFRDAAAMPMKLGTEAKISAFSAKSKWLAMEMMVFPCAKLIATRIQIARVILFATRGRNGR